MFVLVFSSYSRLFSLIWRRQYYRWRALNLDIFSELMAIQQWEFFNVPHLLWHGASFYNGHLRGHMTLTLNAERLAVELSLGTCFNDVTAAVKYEKFRVPVNQTRQFLFLFCGTSLNVLRQIILKLICLHLPSHVLWLKRVSIIITLLNRSFRWRSSWWGYRRSNVPDEHECPCKQIIQKTHT